MPESDALALHPDIMFRSIGEEGIIVDQRQPEVIVVNAQGIRIIELIRETGSRKAVEDRLMEEFEAPADEIKNDLDDFLNQLRERGMIR
jgi:hypothetical protein